MSSSESAAYRRRVPPSPLVAALHDPVLPTVEARVQAQADEGAVVSEPAAKKYDRSKVEENDRRIVEGVEKHTRPSAARIRAAEATTPMLRFRLHLQNASRFNPTSLSRKELRRMIDDPNFLDELEEALRDAK